MARTLRIINNAHAIGGGELSSQTLMTMALRLGYRVVFHPTRIRHPKFHIPDGVEVGPSLIELTGREESDFLVFYANDAVYGMSQEGDLWNSLLDGAERRVFVLNFVLGESWQFSEKVDLVLFLNREKEAEWVSRLKKQKRNPVPTLSLAPPVDLDKFLNLPLPDYSRINFGRSGRHTGKYNESDYNFILDRWLQITPDSEFFFMATPPFIKGRFGKDKRFHLYDWDDLPMEEFLAPCNLFHYRLPKKMRDQGPRVIVEAMARGMAVIGEPRDGAKDRITEETGWFASTNQEFVSCVQAIAQDLSSLKAKGIAARERARSEFNPWRWMSQILNQPVTDPRGTTLTPETPEALLARQPGLLERGSEEKPISKPSKRVFLWSSGYPEVPSIGFGKGHLREPEWGAVRDYLSIHSSVKTILDIGGGYSVFLFASLGLEILTLDNRREILELLAQDSSRKFFESSGSRVTVYRYVYPHFPEIRGEFDLGFIGGPGPNNFDGRRASMEFAKRFSRVIFLRDSIRSGELESSLSAFPPDSWKKTPLPMGLSLFEKKPQSTSTDIEPGLAPASDRGRPTNESPALEESEGGP